MKELISGMFFKKPHEKAPDFVIGNVSIKLDEFANYVKEFKKEHPEAEWMNIDVLISKADKPYCKLNTYKEDNPQNKENENSDLPF